MPKLPKLPALPDPEQIFSVIDKAGDAVGKGVSLVDRVASRIDRLAGKLGPLGESQKEVTVSEKPTSTITRLPLQPELPTREETTVELKRRLAKELYRAELDLSSKLRIAGKPCDCLDSKHTLGLEAAAEELIAQEPTNPVYTEILQWIKNNHPKVTIEAITSGKYDNEYPQMASEFKGFRKRIMGTTVLTAMIESKEQITLEEAKKLAAEEAEKEVELKWHSQEKKQPI